MAPGKSSPSRLSGVSVCNNNAVLQCVAACCSVF